MTQSPPLTSDPAPDFGLRHASGRLPRLAELLTGVAPILEVPLSRGALAFAVVTLIGLAAWVSTVNFWYAYDDALITYRFARNLATGVGLVYNPGEWHLGTTAPLYALILGGLGWLAGPDAIPFFGGLISSVSLAMGGLALVAFGTQHRAPLAGVFAGMFYVTNPMMFVTFAGEMPLQMALILWGLVAYRAERPQIAAAILACAALTRPDGLLAAAVVFGYDVVVRRRILWRAWLVFAAIVAPFVILTWVFYGSPLPGTLSAKLAQRDSGFWPTYFGKGLRGWFRAFLLTSVDGPRFEFFSLDPGTLSFWTTVGVLAVLGFRFWTLPFIWIVLFVIIYRTMKVPFYHWYAAPALVGLSIVTGAGLAALLSLARRAIPLKRAEGPLLVGLGAALVVLAGYPYLNALPETARPHPVIGVYTAVGRWLHDHTPPGSTVGYYEIGFIGYYSDRPIVDSLGLVDPSIPPHVAKGDLAWAFRERRPAFILRKPDAVPLNGFMEEPWFAAEYRERLVFAPPGDPNQHRVILYERRDFSASGGSR
jgi:arabinofuranosyltransferase